MQPNYKKTIVDAMARTAYVLAWANWADESGKRHYPPGAQLEDYAPATPAKAKTWAKKVVAEMEKLNGMTLHRMYVVASSRAIHQGKRPGTPADFGSDLAMEVVGSGVAWSDDHGDHGLLVPRGEVYCHSAKGFDGWVSGDHARRG